MREEMINRALTKIAGDMDSFDAFTKAMESKKPLNLGLDPKKTVETVKNDKAGLKTVIDTMPKSTPTKIPMSLNKKLLIGGSLAGAAIGTGAALYKHYHKKACKDASTLGVGQALVAGGIAGTIAGSALQKYKAKTPEQRKAVGLGTIGSYGAGLGGLGMISHATKSALPIAIGAAPAVAGAALFGYNRFKRYQNNKGKKANMASILSASRAAINAETIKDGNRPNSLAPYKKVLNTKYQTIREGIKKKAGLASTAVNVGRALTEASPVEKVGLGMSAAGLGVSGTGVKISLNQNAAKKPPVSKPAKKANLPLRDRLREAGIRIDTPVRELAAGSILGAASLGLGRAGKVRAALGTGTAAGGLLYRAISKDHKQVKQRIEAGRIARGYY